MKKRSGAGRFLSLLLVVCMLAGMFPAAAFAAGSDIVTYPVTGGNIYFDKSTGFITDCDESVMESVIPEEIEGIAVTWIGTAFSGCSSLESIKIPEGVMSIGSYAFYGCSSLNSIEIPEGVTEIGSYAFYGCSSLNSIEIPEGVTEISHNTFEECRSLESIEIPEGATRIAQFAFRGCSSLSSIEIPKGVTHIEIDTFRGCSSLSSIEIPEGVTSIDWSAFEGCSSLESIKIPKGVTYIGVRAFKDCSSLSSVEILKGITEIESSAFEGCSSLSNIEIPEGVTSIKDSVFRGCSSLNAVEIPEGVTSIESSAFNRCNRLSSIKIPEGVTSIGSYAFYGCSSLSDVYYAGSEEQWSEISIDNIGGGNEYLTDATIHYNSTGPGTGETGSEEEEEPDEQDLFFDFDDLGNESFARDFVKMDESVTYGGGIEFSLKAEDGTEKSREDFLNEFSTIEWTVSDPSIAKITAVSLGDRGEDIELPLGHLGYLCHDWYLEVQGVKPGTVTITGTMENGRQVSRQLYVVPDVEIQFPERISSQAELICKVNLKEADREYLESYLSGMQVTIKLEDPEYNDGIPYYTCDLAKGESSYSISDDGKSAVYVMPVTPTGYGSHGAVVTFRAENGYEVSSRTNIVLSEATFYFTDSLGETSDEPLNLKWAGGFPVSAGYYHDEITAELKIEYNPPAPNDTMTVDYIEFSLTGALDDYFKVKGDSKVELNKTLYAGETCTQAVTLVKRGMFWGHPEKGEEEMGELIAKVSTRPDVESIKDEYKLTVNFSNPQEEQEEVEDEEEKQLNQEILDETSELLEIYEEEDLAGKITLDPQLANYVGGQQAQALAVFVYSAISLANMPEDGWKEAGLSDQIVEKVMDKFLGDWNPDLSMKVRDIPLDIIAKSDDGEKIACHFDCRLTNYLMGSGSYAMSGNIETTLTVGDRTIELGSGMIYEADVHAFTESAWEIASTELKKGYKKVWGDDVNKLANKIFESKIDSLAQHASEYGLKKTLQQILKTYYEKYFQDKTADEIFDVLTYPSKEFVAQCPVDIYVYDGTDTLVGCIENDEVTLDGDGMVLWTEGDDKYVQLFDDSYRVEYRSNGTGTMNLSVYDKASATSALRVCEFKEVPLRVGLDYSESINDEILTDPENYRLTSNQEEVIQADEIEELNSNDSLSADPDETVDPDNPGTPGESTGNSGTTGGGGGGGSTVSSYTIIAEQSENGAVSIDPARAEAGDTVTITVDPEEDYELSSLTVFDQDEDPVEVQKKSDTEYTFVMPDGAVTVKAVFSAVSGDMETGLPFEDISPSAWYRDAIQYVWENGLMNGTDSVTFSPDVTTTRGMIVTILHRMEENASADTSVSDEDSGFSDVDSGQYYADAVKWAVENDIVNGYGDGRFGPEDPITREQMASILYRYAEYKGYDISASADLSGFRDVSDISGYAAGAMRWANAEGLINGMDAVTLDPKGDSTRAQIAAILMRFCENIVK